MTTMATEVRGSLADAVRDLSEWTPEWERAQVFPVRYRGTEEEYLALVTVRCVEYSDGLLEILPCCSIVHQLILGHFLSSLDSFATSHHAGIAVPGGYPVRLWPGKFRTPDLMFMRVEHTARLAERFSEGADLVMEVVDRDNRAHDIETKRVEYARAGIPEYWIVDPEEETITVLVLKARQKTYTEHGVFAKGTRATSKLLPGFSVDVTTAVTQKPEV
jgi:Uma2 family endonuclease